LQASRWRGKEEIKNAKKLHGERERKAKHALFRLKIRERIAWPGGLDGKGWVAQRKRLPKVKGAQGQGGLLLSRR